MKHPLPIFTFALAALFHLPAAPSAAAPFENVGLGGGGAMYVPVCSPHDHQLMFVACDMSGVYRSTNGGRSWQMLDKRELRSANECPLAFDPLDAGRIYAASGSHLKVSDDRGEHWQPLLENAPWKEEAITAIGVEPLAAQTLLVGSKSATWRSADHGATWTRGDNAPSAAFSFVFDTRASKPPRAIFAAAAAGVFRSDDGGLTWVRKSAGLPSGELRGLSGGADPRQLALYATVASREVEGQLEGGVFLSRDRGETWQSAMGQGINRELGKKDRYGLEAIPQYRFIASTRGQPGTAYVTTRGTGYHPPYHWTVFRTDDFGQTWRHCFTGDPREATRNVEDGWLPLDINWGFGGPASGFSVCENDPDIAMFTNDGELYVTQDGARTWQCDYSQRTAPVGSPKPGEAWQSCGLEVTSCWQLTFDPHEPQRVYLCYTDIGFARSEDGGHSWRRSVAGSPWSNSFYGIACDPDRAGVLYAACANQHDIPTWTNVDKPKAGGGVCRSEDFGATWKPVSQGLPEAPVTGIALDPQSPANARTVYAAVFGHGVFKSADGGASWRDVSAGLQSAGNRHAYAVKLDRAGRLYCSITAQRDGRDFADGSGLYLSPDGGATWARLSPPLKWAGDFAFDPVDQHIIYLAAATAPGHAEGGVYKSTDGGGTWQRILKDADLPQDLSSYLQGFFVTVDPRHPGRVFFSAQSHGLFVSDDAGGKWREVPGIPFTEVNRVTPDPHDAETIWVTTFGGGVWKGSLAP